MSVQAELLLKCHFGAAKIKTEQVKYEKNIYLLMVSPWPLSLRVMKLNKGLYRAGVWKASMELTGSTLAPWVMGASDFFAFSITSKAAVTHGKSKSVWNTWVKQTWLTIHDRQSTSAAHTCIETTTKLFSVWNIQHSTFSFVFSSNNNIL